MGRAGKHLSVFMTCIAVSALTACGDGREFHRDESHYNPTPPEERGLPEPGTGSPPTAWSDSDEYRSSNGLRLIKAAEGYAARNTGKPGGAGVTVAVLDTNFDLSHPDLDGRSWNLEGAASLRSDHGTHVAGTIAARRDGSGVHGVAYNAWLHAIEVLEGETGPYLFPTIGDSAANVAAGIASAAGLTESYEFVSQTGEPILDVACDLGVGGACRVDSDPAAKADIINMSLGGHDPLDEIEEVMGAAAREGTIMVAALGNEGKIVRGTVGNAPARYMAQPGIAGMGLAVGALDEYGDDDADFSNLCGDVARYCLFAPGTNIYSTTRNGGYGSLSGTSMAAPHVAGAAAVLKAAFPNKSPRQIVERLLWSADSMSRGKPVTFTSDVSGFEGQERRGDEYYGFGRLNLQRAMMPWGDVGVPTEETGLRPLATSLVGLPPGFRTPSKTSALANVVVYDEQMFPFLYDLNAAFRETGTPTDDAILEGFLSSLGRSSSLPVGRTATIGFAHGGGMPVAPGGREGGEAIEEYWLRVQPLPDVAVAFGQGGGAVGSSNDFVLDRTRRTPFRDSLSVGPYAAFAGEGPAASVDWRLDEGTTVDIASKRGDGYFESTRAWVASAGLTRRIGERLILGARHGVLREDDTLMGIRSEGAFESFSDTATRFFDVSVEARLSNDVTLFGGASIGAARGGAPERNSLVSSWSEVRADSFVVGGEFRNLLDKTDRLTLTAGSPFRPSEAMIRVNVPTEEVSDGIVRYSPQTVDLTPDGRETRLQFVYETDAGDSTVSLVAGGCLRMEPAHDETANTEYGAAAKVRLGF